MSIKLFLITPPFTQLNTPYPATAYLKGFLNTKGIAAAQADLGIDVINKLFSKQGLTKLFDYIESNYSPLLRRGVGGEANSQRIISLKNEYLKTIDQVMLFFTGKEPHAGAPYLYRRFFARSFTL